MNKIKLHSTPDTAYFSFMNCFSFNFDNLYRIQEFKKAAAQYYNKNKAYHIVEVASIKYNHEFCKFL